MEDELTRKEKRQARRAERKANRKPFFQTGVGQGLKAVASLVAPNLVTALDKVTNVTEALGIIRSSDESPEIKAQLQEFTLAQYELEIKDRVSAREREVRVLEAGGNNYLMNILGWSVSAAFLALVVVTLGIYELPESLNKEYFMFGAGAISSAFMTILAYFFGSSAGSKAKTAQLRAFTDD